MKSKQSLRPPFFLIILVLLLSSFERLFEKDADYRYRIENNTSSTAEVVEIQQNLGVVIYRDPNR